MPDVSRSQTVPRAAPPVYLGYAATTPADRRVACKMMPCLTELFGNPTSRSHDYGWAADEAMELAREQVTVLPALPSGLLDLAAFEAALRPDTVLASVMVVNNETGVIQDVAAIGAICRAKKVLLHVDAAQAAGKVTIDLDVLPIDMMSLSAHKI